MEHFYESLEGWFDFADVYREAVERAPHGARFLEVGSYYGRSASFLAVEALNSRKQIHLTCVDPWVWPADVYEKFSAWVSERVLWDFVLPLRGTTIEISRVLPWRETYDFIFIDGDHSYMGVSTDLAFWYPRLKKGGWMAGHDLCPEFPTVEAALCEFWGKEGRPFFEPTSAKSWRMKGVKG